MGLGNAIEAVMMLLVFVITLYAVLLVWQPITATGLYPLLENTTAFTHGATAIVLFQAMVIVVVAMAFLAFVNHVRGGERQPPPYGY